MYSTRNSTQKNSYEKNQHYHSDNMLLDDFRAPVGREIMMEDVSKSDTDSCVYVVSRQTGEGGDRKAEKAAGYYCGYHRKDKL